MRKYLAFLGFIFFFASWASADWTEEKFQCPETGHPIFSSVGPPPSGTIYYDPMDNSSSAFCHYDEGKYELFIHWRKKEPASEKPVVCNDVIRSQESPVHEPHTYYMHDGFGLEIEEKDGEFFLFHVGDYSPAFEAGLKRGEKILALDGRSVLGRVKEDVFKTLQEKEQVKGSSLTVKVRSLDSETPREVTLNLASFDPTGKQITVYSKTHFARVEIHLDPILPITEDMKNHWIGISKEVIQNVESEALSCA